MLKSESLSVYRIIILSLLCFYIQNIWIFIGSVIYLLINSNRNILLFTTLLGILILSSYLHKDFIPVGIIDYKQGNYYICDKGFYKVKLSSEHEFLPGDILHFNSQGIINEFDNQRSRNILYVCDDCSKIFSINIRSFIHKRVDSYDNESKAVLNKVLFNINDYENNQYNLGYGLMSYYFFMFVFRKNKYISVFLVFLCSLCFSFDVKYILIILEFFLSGIELHSFDKFTIKMYVLALLNKEFINNYSLIIPLLISLYGVLKINIHFRSYMAMVMMSLFHEIDPVSSLLFPLLIKIQSGIFVLSILYLLFPFISKQYILIIGVYSFLNGVHLSIRGSLNLLTIFILSGFLSKRSNKLIEFLIIVLVATSPFNNPYFHISYIDVGQGNSTLIRNPFNGKCVLIDTGSSYNYSKLKNYLYSESIYVIDKLIITHNDLDHNGNINSLYKDFKVLEVVTDGIDIDLDKIRLKYYFVDEYDNDNDNSLIYTLDADGYRFLFTGDISSKVERDFINKYAPFKCDFFLASHHGSNTGNSDYFVSNIMPKYTIISTSGMYNHPSIDTLNTLDSYKVKYYLTKEHGTIRIDMSRYLDLLTLYKGGFVIIMKK